MASGSWFVLTLYISLDKMPGMDTRFELHGITFVWGDNKALTNLRQHGITFEQAAEAFFDPFLWNLLFVVHLELEEDAMRIIGNV